jgi:hypothetical protein
MHCWLVRLISGRSRVSPNGARRRWRGRASRCSADGNWFSTGLHSDHDALYPVAQGGPQRLWDTVESSYFSWRRLGEPGVKRFGVTALDDAALQYVCLTTPSPGTGGRCRGDRAYPAITA